MCLTVWVAFLTSCTRENDAITEQSDVKFKKEVESLVNDWGFAEDSIVIMGENSFCEHDIEIPLSGYFENFTSPTLENTIMDGNVVSDRRHRKWFFLVSTYANSTRWIPVNIWSNVPTLWRNAVYSAISEWNALNGKVKFYGQNINSDPWGGIGVKMENLPSGHIAAGNVPLSNGNPGEKLKISNSFLGWGIPDQKKQVIAHELGHTLGFLHTDSQEANPLVTANYWCNNAQDYQSVMRNGGSNMGIWQGFSGCDQAAFYALYGW